LCYRSPRRVSFADSLGYDLESIRIMSEGIDTPPKLLNCNVSNSSNSKQPSLRPLFAQPITDYNDYLRRLSSDCVCLESLDINEKAMRGLVKVRNIDYTKSVKIRYTADNWRSCEELECYYLNPAFGAAKTSIYDTFHFQLSIDERWSSFEFCISYKCKGEQFWDNNNGANYRLDRSSLQQSK